MESEILLWDILLLFGSIYQTTSCIIQLNRCNHNTDPFVKFVYIVVFCAGILSATSTLVLIIDRSSVMVEQTFFQLNLTLLSVILIGIMYDWMLLMDQEHMPNPPLPIIVLLRVSTVCTFTAFISVLWLPDTTCFCYSLWHIIAMYLIQILNSSLMCVLSYRFLPVIRANVLISTRLSKLYKFVVMNGLLSLTDIIVVITKLRSPFAYHRYSRTNLFIMWILVLWFTWIPTRSLVIPYTTSSTSITPSSTKNDVDDNPIITIETTTSDDSNHINRDRVLPME